ncbi:uncharacterized protein MJAP1_000967 [Malassezia japonica]|uniref:Efficient mitochondria targeting-associated protein 19 n=1 Tax=Malassezia japonica TaxID=223818 RepID=A0AAF0EZE8_9BASI|nr:uncharacterized protein MJAP1_000967 [Malassezia japonica]WFD38019.1 hypothetical protein MJAP1_000967 [Malassezia japonica]
MTEGVPLRRRYVDLFYFVYFAFHLFASLCVDIQGLLPPAVVPEVLRNVLQDYLEQSADPLIPNVWHPRYAWFRVSLLSEFVIQVPAFVIGMVALWNDDKRVYPLLAVYGLLGSFTTLQCIAMVTMGEERALLSSANLAFILQNYIPFFVLPGVIMVDMVVRIMRLLSPRRIKTE